MNDPKYTLKKIDIFLIVFLAVIVVITFLSALNRNIGEFFTINNYFKSDTLRDIPFWAAVGFTMLVCFLGALVPFPIPYSLPVSLFAATWYTRSGSLAWGPILLLVALATAANMVGDLIDYMIGRGANYIMSKEDPDIETRWSKIILSKPKAIPGVIVLFGLTPLPDSLLMVPLGMVEYDIRKTMLFMYIGRFGMMLIFALAGIFAIDLIFSEGSGDDPFGWVFGIVLLYVLWVLIAIMTKYKPKKEDVEEIKDDVDNHHEENEEDLSE